MADRSSDLNPYAPPKADGPGPGTVGAAPTRGAAPTPDQIAVALARLKHHVASPENLAADARAGGGLLRPVTLVFAALFVLALVGGAAVAVKVGEDGNQTPLFVAGAVAVFCGILAAALVAADLSLGKRTAPAPPDKALRRFARALGTGRNGYAWSTLGPTAREQVVAAPRLGPIVTGEGQFAMGTVAGVKAYAMSFARPGQKQMRTMRAKAVSVRSAQGDVALVDATWQFQAWPQWITVVFGVSAGVFRPGLLVAAILFFVMRKRLETTVTKVLLQGQPGIWYLLDADVLEGYRPPV